jgi:hypothetical protein
VAASPAAAPALASDDEPARVADATGAAVSSGEVARHRDGRRTMGRLPANLGRCAIGVWSADNLVPFLAGGAAASAASFADQEVRESAVATDWGDAFETGAGPVWSSVFVAGMFTAGRLSDGPRLRAMTYDMLDAAIVNFAYSEVIKVAVGRGRPNGEDVVAGATLGYIVGRTVVRVNGRPLGGEARGASLPVSPTVGRRTRGVPLAVVF